MIRSTKTTLKFSNTGKLTKLHSFIDEYQRAVGLCIDVLWAMEKIPTLLPIEITSKIETWLSKRAIQCAGKQASGIVRGTKKKQTARLWQINQFKKLGLMQKAKKLKAIYHANSIAKPNVKELPCELDSRFVQLDLENETSFDGWMTLTSLGNKLKIAIPIKQHKHFNEMILRGNIKGGVRLSKQDATFMFDIEEPKEIETGKTLGIDVGQKTTLSCSDGQVVNADKHGHTYQTICNKLARKKKGSRNFEQSHRHRSDYLRWVVKQLNLTGVSVVNRENIKNLRKFSRTSRKLGHWNYAELFEVLDLKLEERGVRVNRLSPTYTSQRCSACGWVRKTNRSGKKFRCEACSHEQDADLNAAANLALNLRLILAEERLLHKNKAGFYWHAVGEAPMVPHTQKTKKQYF